MSHFFLNFLFQLDKVLGINLKQSQKRLTRSFLKKKPEGRIFIFIFSTKPLSRTRTDSDGENTVKTLKKPEKENQIAISEQISNENKKFLFTDHFLLEKSWKKLQKTLHKKMLWKKWLISCFSSI